MTQMNKTICEFLQQNGLDLNHIPEELNRSLNSPNKETILSSFLYAMYSEIREEEISVADIYGSSFLENFYEEKESVFLLDLLGNYFDETKNEYHTRSIGLLKYPSSQIVQTLSSSFFVDPIYLIEIENKLYVSINGNHRIMVLLFHYLNQVRIHPEKKEQLKKKFQIPVKIESLNLEFSAMQYLLKMKYGSRYQKNSFVLKEDSITFLLNQEQRQMTFSEFRLFVQTEFSRKTCSFSQMRDLSLMILLSSKRDFHFKKAVEKIFGSFSKLNLDKIEIALGQTKGYEPILEVLTENLSFLEIFNVIQMMLEKSFSQKQLFQIQKFILKHTVTKTREEEKKCQNHF